MQQQSPEPRASEPGRIVDEIFSLPDRARRHRWKVAMFTTAGIYAVVFGALPFFAAPTLQEWASALAARVHAELERDREVAIETPPPPRPEPPPPAAPPAAPTAARPVPRSARPRAAAPPAPATAAAIVAASGPVDLTGTTFVTGTSAIFAGGATTSRGTNQNAVEGHTVDAKGPPVARPGRGRPVRLDQADWSCPWPHDADAAEINEQVVLLRVAVKADGDVDAVRVLSDPGFGFGQAARACALRTRFEPAQDEGGNPVFAWSPPIRVRFIR